MVTVQHEFDVVGMLCLVLVWQLHCCCQLSGRLCMTAGQQKL